MRKSLISTCILIALFFLNGCSYTSGPVTLQIDYNSPKNTSIQLASLSPLKLKVMAFEDKRERKGGSLHIGETQAAFNVPLATVYIDQPITSIIKKAMEDEFTRCKHQIVMDSEDVVIKGDIQTFWIGTDVTALYWDVYGEIGLLFKIYKSATSSGETFGPYYAKNVERTYHDPSAEIMKTVIEKSLKEVIYQMSNDNKLINFLANSG